MYWEKQPSNLLQPCDPRCVFGIVSDPSRYFCCGYSTVCFYIERDLIKSTLIFVPLCIPCFQGQPFSFLLLFGVHKS